MGREERARGAKRAMGTLYAEHVKRFLDIIFSCLLLLFLCLPMLVIAVMIRSESEGGAIFKQKRMGRGGKVFVCYKFRTMYKDAPPYVPAAKLGDVQSHVTRVGGFLRRSSLDELPQLINVLVGDMSLVGPRPLICDEVDIHERRMEEGIYALRPGITGMAQISGRNLLDDGEKLENDKYYLQNIRPSLDAKILLRTVAKVITKEGVSREKE